MRRVAFTLLAGLAVSGCRGADQEAGAGAGDDIELPDVEAISLLGEPLVRPALSDEARASLEQNLAAAQRAYDNTPENADSIIWLGRRLAYLSRYRDAIEVFTRGVLAHPDDPRMYRHRGHRYITIREFDNAIRDLEHATTLIRGSADEVEPDGVPNASGIPVSTLHGNIWYHLALAHYVKHEFEAALPAWTEARRVSTNDDMLVATSDWLYMTYRRLGREADAAAVLEPIHADMTILENTAYHRRLLMYRGDLPADSLMRADTDDPVQLATYGYGLANWRLVEGDTAAADALFRRIIEQPGWAAFGFIAAEAELAAGKPAAAQSP